MTFSCRSVALGVGACLAACLAFAAPARADLVVLSSGRVISASSVVLNADTATIRLRGGGEVTCSRSLVVRVDPDETPWIDPPSATASTGISAAVKGDGIADAVDRGAGAGRRDPGRLPRRHHPAGQGARRRRPADRRGDLSRVGVPAAGAIAQGRARPDAGDAGHRSTGRRRQERSLQGVVEPRCRRPPSQRAARSLCAARSARRLQRRRGRRSPLRRRAALPGDAPLRRESAGALRTRASPSAQPPPSPDVPAVDAAPADPATAADVPSDRSAS